MPYPTNTQRVQARNRPVNCTPVMYQQWRDLLFLHWEFDADLIQNTLPSGLTVDCYNGKSYLGVVPFFMQGIRPKYCPAVPGISHFAEMNLRTYVYDQSGRPGVWFYSLDATKKLAVTIARTFFHLPYFPASIKTGRNDGQISYSMHRKGTDIRFDSSFTYRGIEDILAPTVDTLEFFLVERYLLFSQHPHSKKMYCGQVHHQPYELRKPCFEIHKQGLISLAGFPNPVRAPDHATLSNGVNVEIYRMVELA